MVHLAHFKLKIVNEEFSFGKQEIVRFGEIPFFSKLSKGLVSENENTKWLYYDILYSLIFGLV